MRFRHFAISFTALLVGCGNKSSVCVSENVISAINVEIKKDNLLFDKIKSETLDPPFHKDAQWINLSGSLSKANSEFEKANARLSKAKDLCHKSKDSFKNGKKIDINFVSFFAAYGVMTRMLELSSSQLSDLGVQVCSGDLSYFSEYPAVANDIFRFLMPNRYSVWKGQVNPAENAYEHAMSEQSRIKFQLAEYEYTKFKEDFRKVKYNLSDASLDSQNESETNYVCSANVTSEMQGYKNIAAPIVYVVKITSEGNEKIEIERNKNYTDLMKNDALEHIAIGESDAL